MKKIVIGQNETGQRLDKFLRKYFKNMSLNIIYKSIRKKRIKVNGKSQKKSYNLSLGDVLELYINDDFFAEKSSEKEILTRNIKLTIIYEDENILVSYKPQGIITHEDKNEKKNTFINWIKSYLYQKGEYNPKLKSTFSPALCHRLDRNTNGLIICAKNYESLKIINEKIKNKEIEKYYKCIVNGIVKPSRGTIDTFLLKDCIKNRVFVCDKSCVRAKRAITKYKVLKFKDNFSIIEAQIITGRTHQIRASFSNIGHPIVGDSKYSIKKDFDSKQKFQALCAYKIIFNFKTDSGILNYLNKKTFEINKELIFENIMT
ncbi:MAG: RluA family pseudouridine synthase [Clostridiales bacterium]|jgi:23S rRNA pseudouridine955/2504/2580 synthase|nr:RluA family pseudouridine synthase [Clostridiales bacterium]